MAKGSWVLRRDTNMNSKNIGLSLSGGGVRATVFHLGVLKELANQNLFDSIKTISSVSGGSLAIALIYANNENKWPSGSQFLNEILAKIEIKLMAKDIQKIFMIKSLSKPWSLFTGRANLLAKVLEVAWNIKGSLQDLEGDLNWIINSTHFNNGKNFRFSKEKMGDYKLGYVSKPDFAISHAVAASAAFPGLIGPLKLNKNKYQWTNSLNESKKSHLSSEANVDKKTNNEETESNIYKDNHPNSFFLWDGGVYDNLGLEAIFKIEKGFNHNIDYLIVSDASLPIDYEWRKNVFTKAYRLIDISMNQVKGLMARNVINYFSTHNQNGLYLQIGNDPEEFLADRIKQQKILLNKPIREFASHFPTCLSSLKVPEFESLLLHGQEVAEATILKYGQTLKSDVQDLKNKVS
jgi:NTE family protein